MELGKICDARGSDGKRVRNRVEREIQLRKLLDAENEALKKGFRGWARFDLLRRTVGLDRRTEDRQVRRMLHEARRMFDRLDEGL
jgi:hypothetical protein